jgi:hypothetical protein
MRRNLILDEDDLIMVVKKDVVKQIDEREWFVEGVSYISSEGAVVHNPNSKTMTQDELDSLPLPRYDVLPPMQRYQPRYRKRY